MLERLWVYQDQSLKQLYRQSSIANLKPINGSL